MEITKKQEALRDVYKAKKVEDKRETILVLNEDSEIVEDVKRIQYELNEETGTFELDYEIMHTACEIVAGIPEDELESADVHELSMDTASVYTAERLSWLGINNHGDISDIMKEYECDIDTACAVWYEQQVATACTMLINWLTD